MQLGASPPRKQGPGDPHSPPAAPAPPAPPPALRLLIRLIGPPTQLEAPPPQRCPGPDGMCAWGGPPRVRDKPRPAFQKHPCSRPEWLAGGAGQQAPPRIIRWEPRTGTSPWGELLPCVAGEAAGGEDGEGRSESFRPEHAPVFPPTPPVQGQVAEARPRVHCPTRTPLERRSGSPGGSAFHPHHADQPCSVRRQGV